MHSSTGHFAKRRTPVSNNPPIQKYTDLFGSPLRETVNPHRTSAPSTDNASRIFGYMGISSGISPKQ